MEHGRGTRWNIVEGRGGPWQRMRWNMAEQHGGTCQRNTMEHCRVMWWNMAEEHGGT